MSEPAAADRPRSVRTLIISNDGASTSRNRTKFDFQDSDESSPPNGSTSPSKSEESIASTSNSSVCSDSDDQSKFFLHTSREHASETVAQRAATALTPPPRRTLDLQLNDRAPSLPVEAGVPESKSDPGWMASLRMSLASFISRLFPPSKKVHKETLSETQEDDQKESERLDRYAARTALLPLSLPNELVLYRRTRHHPRDHGIKIVENCCNIPLLAGYRERSHLHSKFREVGLCLGSSWYATWTPPFLKAYVQNHEITVQVCDHQLATAPEITIVKVRQSPEDKHAWFFQADVPGPIDETTLVKEDFEWHTRQSFVLTGEKKRRHGSYLVKASTQNVVAVLTRRLRKKGSSIVAMSFTVAFSGSGQQYGGLWKIIVFVIGLCAYH